MEKLNIDKKKAFPLLHKGAEKSFEFAGQYNEELAELLKKIFVIVMRPLLALRAKLYRFFFRSMTTIEEKRIPVFRLGIVLVAFFMIYHKNFSFAFSLNNPVPDMEMVETGDSEGFVKPINEYAPVSSDNLKGGIAEEYIQQYAELAVAEMEKFGIPASITLGQALIESRSGTSRLARENQNHFGIKCFSKKCTKGHCSNHFDDHHKDFFRKYDSVWQSYRDHSKFLTRTRYKELHKYGKDYKKWATGLKKAGYATDKRYDKKLIGVIQKYKLHRFDG